MHKHMQRFLVDWETSTARRKRHKFRSRYSLLFHSHLDLCVYEEKKEKNTLENDATIEIHPCIVYCVTVILFSFCASASIRDTRKTTETKYNAQPFLLNVPSSSSAVVVGIVARRIWPCLCLMNAPNKRKLVLRVVSSHNLAGDMCMCAMLATAQQQRQQLHGHTHTQPILHFALLFRTFLLLPCDVSFFFLFTWNSV